MGHQIAARRDEILQPRLGVAAHHVVGRGAPDRQEGVVSGRLEGVEQAEAISTQPGVRSGRAALLRRIRWRSAIRRAARGSFPFRSPYRFRAATNSRRASCRNQRRCG